jgi:tetratricopeptide (TPR) repeat protein
MLLLLSTPRRWWTAAMVAAIALGTGAPAGAQPGPPPQAQAQAGQAGQPSAAELAAARQLFGDGLRAEDEGRYADGLAAFLRVEKITASPQLRYHLGFCHEKLGQLVEALNAFELAAADAEARGARDVLKESRARAEALRPKIARLVLRVPTDAAGLVMTVDDRPVNAALAGAPLLVNPGDRRVAVRADNYAGAFTVTVGVGPGESRTVEVALGAKRAAPRPELAPPPPVAPPPAPKRNYVPAYAAAGVTGALAVAALATGIAAHVDYSQYLRENVSPPSVPLTERDALRSAGLAKAWASTGLTLGTLLAAGATVYLAVRPPQAEGRAPAVSAWFSPEGGGLVIKGAL